MSGDRSATISARIRERFRRDRSSRRAQCETDIIRLADSANAQQVKFASNRLADDRRPS